MGVKLGSASTMINLLTTGHGARVSTSFRSLGSVLGATLLPVVDPGRIEGSANDVIPDAGQVSDSAATYQHNGVLLKVVSLSRNVGGYLSIIAETHPADLPQRGIRLPRRQRFDDRTHAALLWRPLQLDSSLLQRVIPELQVGRLGPLLDLRTALMHQLTGCRQAAFSSMTN